MSISEAEIRAIVADVVARLASGAGGAGERKNGAADSSSHARQLDSRAGASQSGRVVAIGADHGGFALKEHLREYLRNIGYQVLDCGTYSTDAVDYPDIAVAVGRKVASAEAGSGIMLDGAGIGSSMAANKVKGVRAALCYNEKTVINSKQHNNANVLTLGAPYHRPEEAEALVKLWLETDFEGGRHQKRVDKIDALDQSCSCQSQTGSCGCSTK